MSFRDILSPEVVEFCIPSGSSHTLHLPDITWCRGEDLLQSAFSDHFSQFGLLHQVTVTSDGPDHFYRYVRFYSSRSTSRARLASRGGVSIEGSAALRVTGHGACAAAAAASRLPLARYKCEQLANYYLGFGGWSSKVLYHRKEDAEVNIVKYVTVVRLEFCKDGLQSEGAAMVEVEVEGGGPVEGLKAVVEATKRSKGEAMQVAWSKVVMVVVGNKVMVEINTTKKNAFFYDPLWEEDVVKVNKADYDALAEQGADEELMEEWTVD